MLIENKGIKTDNFSLPSFDLNVGEIVVLYLFNGQHFYETEMFLKDIFCGKTKDENVVVLSLYASLSKTNNIVFDVVGQDPKGAEETYEIVKEVVKKGGSAILLDCFENMKNDCTKYIELQWTKE